MEQARETADESRICEIHSERRRRDYWPEDEYDKKHLYDKRGVDADEPEA